MAEAQYASGTDVPAEKTRIEIERFLKRRGATAIASYWDEGKAMLGFTLQGRSYRLDVPLPDRNDGRVGGCCHPAGAVRGHGPPARVGTVTDPAAGTNQG